MMEVFLAVCCAFLQAFASAAGCTLVMMPAKTGKKKTFFMILFGFWLCNAVSVMIPYSVLKPFAGYIFMYLWMLFWYKEGWKEVLVYFTLVFGITILLECISVAVLGKNAVSADPLSEQMAVPRIIVSILTIFLQTGWMYLIRRLRENWNSEILKKFYAFIIAQFVLEILALQAVGMNYLKETGEGRKIVFDDTSLLVYRIGIIAFILVTALSYYLIFYYMKKEYLKEQIHKRESEMEEDMKYYQSVEKKTLYMRKIRHDIGNHLQMVESLVEEDPERAQEYLTELKRTVQRM